MSTRESHLNAISPNGHNIAGDIDGNVVCWRRTETQNWKKFELSKSKTSRSASVKAMNNDTIVGYLIDNIDHYFQGRFKACIWSFNGTIKQSKASQWRAISANSIVIGSIEDHNNGQLTAIKHENGKIESLAVPENVTGSEATTISTDGTTIGGWISFKNNAPYYTSRISVKWVDGMIHLLDTGKEKMMRYLASKH